MDNKTMHFHVVFAMSRKDQSERIVSLQVTQEDAQRLGHRIVAAMSEKFVRCRTRQMDLTVAQVKSLVHEWGRQDALEGEPLDRKINLPRPYAAAYRAGYRLGKKLAAEEDHDRE